MMRHSNFRALPFEQWPAIDRNLWSQHTTIHGSLNDIGPWYRWRPATQGTVITGYGMALHWLAYKRLLDEKVAPSARWTPDRLREYIENQRTAGCREATVRHRVVTLCQAISVIAPTADRTLFFSAIAGMRLSHADGRKRVRLQDPGVLAELGFRIMRRAEADQAACVRKAAARYRLGLQVALLALRPLRMSNFISICIGVHLEKVRGGWRLRFSGEETKNHRAFDVAFPDELVGALENYLAVYRTLLAGGRYRGDRLWLGYRFKPESAHNLQLSISRVTQAAFSHPINPHLFRDCAATSIAIHDPKAIRIAATILGHCSFGITERHYNLATGLEAGRAYAKFVNAKKSRSRRRASDRS